MAKIQPFKGVRPDVKFASAIAALPYDVYSREEARKVVESNPLSFLKIDRAETQFPEDTDMYSQAVYERARDTIQEMKGSGQFVQDEEPCYYIYALTMGGRTQTGLVCCVAIDDYLQNVVKKHENTREDKEIDRICHVDTCSAQTGPIFLAYRTDSRVKQMIAEITCQEALYDFESEDGVRHSVWKVEDKEWIDKVTAVFAEKESLYIADGHHRAASAVKAGLKRREEHPDYDGTEEFNYFLSVVFSEDELCIYDYNRVVYGLGEYTEESLLGILGNSFEIEKAGAEAFRPGKKGEVGMYVGGNWYSLKMKPQICSEDPIDGLDVSILQNVVLGPLLGIQDPKGDPRIAFVGGIRGLDALKEIVDEKKDAVAFAMYPTSMQELLCVADCGKLMPPKSTWFEPKLRSGLFIHEF